jgi:hypothetical protein
MPEPMGEKAPDKEPCQCPKCQMRRGEKSSVFKLRQYSTRMLRNFVQETLLRLKVLDGWAIGVTLLKEENGEHVQHFTANVHPSKYGMEAAADVAAKAIELVRARYNCTREEARKIFDSMVLERELARKADTEEVVENLKGLLPQGLRDKLEELSKKGLSAFLAEEEAPPPPKPPAPPGLN